MTIIRTNGINLAYEICGAGETLVLIPGLGYDRWMWHKMIPGLSEAFQVIAIDNRGSGESDKPDGPYTAWMLAEDVAGLLAELNIPKAHIMGHSMGGFIAQALALSHPEILKGLVLSATNFGGPYHIPVTPEAMAVLTDISGDPAERFKRGLLVSCAPGFGDARPEIIDEWMSYRAHSPLLPGPYQAQLAIGLGLLTEEASFQHRLKEIQAPTLILFGEHDQVVPPGNAELLARELPNSTIRILPDAGHFFPLEKPDEANTVIVEFLAGKQGNR